MRLGAVCAEPNAGGRARPLRTRASQIRGLSRPPLSRTSQISQVATGATTFLNDDAYDGNDADPTCFQSDNVLFARLEAATQSLLAFTAIAEEDLDAKVPTHRPPRLSKLVDVVGSVPEFDWHSATASDALMTELINTLRNGDSTLREPVILRGAADGWPCVADGTKTWTLTNLVKNHADFEGETRVRNNENSNTLSQQEFQYVEGNHPAVKNGTFKAPSRVEQLTIADVAKRMTGKQSDGNISGNVYMQAALSHALAQDAGIDEKQLQEPWLSFQAAGWVETQEPRIWLSQAGSTSSLHYDTSVSVLAQVNGLKRMLLYPPSALSKAYLYPDWHPLRRRSGVRLDQDSNRNDAAHCAFPRWSGSDVGVDGRAQEGHGRDTRGAEKENAASVNKSGRTSSKPPGAWEAVLGPGDVLVFPPRWAHYTESVGPRVASSVTKRYKVPKTNDDMRVSEALQKLVAGNENENETDASETETGTGTSSNANAHSSQVARFARWQNRKGGPSLGTRDLGQLERSGVVRAMRQRVLRLDERGRVLREDVAYLSRSGNKSGTNYLSGRGGLEQFREQWRLCAEDAACVATSALEGYGVHTQSSNTSAAPNTGEGRVVGVYLRGSAARGDAIAGVSDLDLVVLCWDDGSTSAKTLKKALRESFTRRANDSGNSVRSASNSGSSSSWTSRWQHLATKADTKLVLVPPPPHPAGVAVVNVLDGVESHTKSQFLLFEALALCLGKEVSFALAVESVTVAGADLPRTLPDACRTPPVRCASTLRADVVEALADGGERSLKWALRRVLRAGFELESGVAGVGGVGGGGGSWVPGVEESRPWIDSDGSINHPDGGVAGASRLSTHNHDSDGSVGPGARRSTHTKHPYYTRDLFRCAKLIASQRPELGEDVATALVAAVHGPKTVYGALWYAGGNALASRLSDALVRDEEEY